MVDDIVTRLREHASQIRCVVGVNTSVVIPMLELEAADEIERVRNALASCQSDLNYWYERCTRAEACANIMHNKLNKKWWKR